MTEKAFYDALVLAWLGLAVAIFIILWFIQAPYGRFARSGFGPGLSPHVGWIIMESPAVFVFLLLYVAGAKHTQAGSLALLVLWMIHYVHRTFFFPFTLRGDRGQFMLLTVLMGFAFNVGNAYLNARWLFTLGPDYPASWLLDPRFIIGSLLFWGGFFLNKQSDSILIHLREPGETGYKIPRGGLFEYVSCPNYLGEIMQWGGWALACFSPGALVFFVWTAANLIPRAFSIHHWYRDNLPDYPEERKAFLPFVV